MKQPDILLLRLTWQKRLWSRVLIAPDGMCVEVENVGDFDDVKGRFSGARIKIGETVFVGDVEIAENVGDSVEDYENVILRVTYAPLSIVCKAEGTVIPQVVMDVPTDVIERWDNLKWGASFCYCGTMLGKYEPLKRVAMVTRLLSRRLERKYNELMDIHTKGGSDWNNTLYVMTFRAMAGSKNKDAYTILAQSVPYVAVSRERSSLIAIEAMFLGAAGLLHGRDEDEYMCRLNDEFDHLRHKYDITPMRPIQWDMGGALPSGNPVLRIAQLAAFFASKEFVFSKVMECRTTDDLVGLFGVEASDYWSTHYVPAKVSGARTKKIGFGKSQLLGINLVVPIMFAYGKFTADEQLQEQALQLLEKIECEKNTIIDKWRVAGMPVENAFDSQAVLELNNEFCKNKACAACPLGKTIIIKQ